MNRKKRKIAQSFQSWLLLLVVIALLATVAFLWVFQTQLSINNTDQLLRLNIQDVQQDVLDAADDQLLTMTDLIIQEIDAYGYETDLPLQTFAWKYGLSEINLVNEDGIIYASTTPAFIDFDMSSGAQSAEFLCLLEGEKQFVQTYQPISYNEAISRKYGGVALEDGGFIQVGYDAISFQKAINHQITRAAQNRHVGENGGLIIVNEDWVIISDRAGNIGSNLADAGIVFSEETTVRGEYFQAEVYGEPCYCMYEKAEGYYILAYMPQSEVVLSRNVSVSITTAMEIIVFVALFILIYILVRRLIVKNLQKINCSLAKITEGDLDETVDVRSHEEFADLSDDINTTVGTLKKYIADAEARIDAELVLAKTIQLSALPSVFPPFPDRKEFDISAAMVTAKEVGGDFYDFYFLGHELLGFLVADVSGKGIPAAMFMMTSKTVIKANAERRAEVHDVFTRA
ncbi:MAG: SpoIIE family protein phosphatase, partial [Firmicutes bacterium]|nr:SpoIIE family protein phosphatase [Bacillota bacterium]